jgi:SAM-dependent methyltransferase
MFDQGNYWKTRVAGSDGVGMVGHRTMGVAYNQWIYRRRVDAMSRWLGERNLPVSEGAVLELGCGTGFWVEFWAQCGVSRLTGVDITPSLIASLQARYPSFNFLCTDLRSPEGMPSTRFDVVTLFDVLYHITDRKDATEVLKRAVSALSDTGCVLVFDQLSPTKDYQLRKHVVFRHESTLTAMASEAGLVCSEQVPLFVTLEPPIFGRAWLDLPILGTYYLLGMTCRAIPFLGDWLGRAAYAIDTRLLENGGRWPNHRMLVFRRKG